MLTDYVVLRRLAGAVEGVTVGGVQEAGGNTSLEEVGMASARSAQDAVASYVKANGLKGGVFYAVPSRSFKPITVEAEQQTRLKFK